MIGPWVLLPAAIRNCGAGGSLPRRVEQVGNFELVANAEN